MGLYRDTGKENGNYYSGFRGRFQNPVIGSTYGSYIYVLRLVRHMGSSQNYGPLLVLGCFTAPNNI